MASKSVIIVGCGDMGLPIARRLGAGRHVFLCDFSDALLSAAQSTLTDEGHTVTTTHLDMSNYVSVKTWSRKLRLPALSK